MTKVKIFLMFSFFILFLVIASSITFSQQIPQEISVKAEGTCREFDITIKADVQGCWDVKIDAPGMLLHEDDWLSSYFYVEKVLCSGEAKLKMFLNSNENTVPATLKLRQNNTIVEKQFDITQDCPQQLSEQESLFVVAAIIIIFAAGIAIYLKKPKKLRKQRVAKRKKK